MQGCGFNLEYWGGFPYRLGEPYGDAEGAPGKTVFTYAENNE